MSEDSGRIGKHHHITLCVGAAKEDLDFHTRVLGLKNVKRTALYDGTAPIYHLYYGNDLGEESTLVTTFPLRQSGRRGRKGAGQISTLALSVPVDALTYWSSRLSAHGFVVKPFERFGAPLLSFEHPCGIAYELVGIEGDARQPYGGGGVASECAIRGTHGICVTVHDAESMEEFMTAAWSARRVDRDGAHVRYETGDGGSGHIVDLRTDPNAPRGTWTFGEGTIHHCAFQVEDFAAQDAVKLRLESLGFTDVSERKDRGYFHSIYVRSPGGPLLEAAVSKPEGFLIDETYEELGTQFQVPPMFVDRRDEILAYLEPLS